MTPRVGNVSLWPIVVASKIRALFEYKRLDLRMRARIRARRHTQGLSLSPISHDDAEACKWILAQAHRWGVVKWTRSGWVKEKPKLGTE